MLFQLVMTNMALSFTGTDKDMNEPDPKIFVSEKNIGLIAI